MTVSPVLFMGGSGAIGHQTAKALRAAYPDVPLLIGGRDAAKAQSAARRLGHSQGVTLDYGAPDLGLGERPVSAVVVFYMDHSLCGLRFAQQRGIPHISISSGIFEIAPEVALYMHAPDAAPIVLGYEWMVGATTASTLHLAQAFARLDDIRIGALVDEQDAGGPAVASDFEHLAKMLPAALTRREGVYTWREDAGAKTVFHALDGTPIEASGFSSIDVAALAAATGAPNVQFNLATGVSSTRRRGGRFSTEIIIELKGEGLDGERLSTRHAVVHPEGAAALTGFSLAMLLERLMGLDGEPRTPAGLYFPYQLLSAEVYLARLRQAGGELRQLAIL